MKDEEYSPYQTILWDDYKTEYKSPEENKSFWVVVPKTEIDNFVNDMHIDLDTQLFGFEWPARDDFRFLLDSKKAEPFHVLLGHKDRLMFQDFQIHFEVKRSEFLAILHNLSGGSDSINDFLTDLLGIAIISEQSKSKTSLSETNPEIAIISEEPKPKTLEEVLSKFPRLINLEYPQSRYISKSLTLNSFIFEPERINKYCTACIPDRLDFLLTYRNSDIVRALKAGPDGLKMYLETCPRVLLTDPHIEQTVSLLFPSYLRSYMMYSYQLLSDQHDSFYSKRLQRMEKDFTPWEKGNLDCFRKDYNNSRKKRKCLDLDDLWNVLCILSNDLASLTKEFPKFREKRKVIAELPAKVNATFKILESYRSDNSESVFPPERVAQIYDRHAAPESKLADCSCDEDIFRYLSAAQQRVNIDQVSLRAFVDWLRRDFKRCFDGMPRCDFVSEDYISEDLSHIISYSFIGSVTPKDHYNFDFGGRLWPYLCDSSWYNRKLITDRTKLPLEYRAKIYARYLELNEYLSFIISRVSCLPVIHKALKDLSDCIFSVELSYLEELLEEFLMQLPENDEKLSDDEVNKIESRFDEFRNTVINVKIEELFLLPFRRLPQSHLNLLAKFDVRIESLKQALANRARMNAEKERAIAEAREKTQREDFTMMNHSIKNLITSVTRNLSKLDRDFLDDEAREIVLRRARQGADLVAQITQAISLSYRRIGNDWKTDLIPANATKFVWDDIISDALFFSIPNMFIDNYSQYQQESSAYFPNQEDLPYIEKNWNSLPDAETRIEWICKNMLDLELHVEEDVYKLKIGGLYATHLFILFNELFLNAIKAAAHVQRDQRSLSLCLQIKEEMLVVDLFNSCNSSENPSRPSHGFGLLIIENYRKMFQINDFSSELFPDKYQYRQHFSIQVISKS